MQTSCLDTDGIEVGPSSIPVLVQNRVPIIIISNLKDDSEKSSVSILSLY